MTNNPESPTNKQQIRERQRARVLIVQALYQWLLSEQALNEIDAQFCVANNMEKIDGAYFRRVFYGVSENLDALEAAFSPYLDRPLDELNPVERSILRLGAFELLYCPEIPYRIVLDESISLARSFGAQDGYRYINGVLNRLAEAVRKLEYSRNNE